MNKQISWTKVDYRAYVSFIVWRRASHPVMQHYRFPKLSSLCFFLFQSIFCKNFKKTAVSLTSTSTHHHPTAAQTFPQMIENTDKVLVLAFVMITVNVIWQNEAPTNGGQTRHNACECVFVFLQLSTQKITLGPSVCNYLFSRLQASDPKHERLMSLSLHGHFWMLSTNHQPTDTCSLKPFQSWLTMSLSSFESPFLSSHCLMGFREDA